MPCGKMKPDAPRAKLDTKDHEVPLTELLERLGTNDVDGLTCEEAETRLAIAGLNKLTPPPHTPQWIVFLAFLFGGYNSLLWIGSLASFVAYGDERSRHPFDAMHDNLYLGILLMVAVAVMSVFQFLQDRRSRAFMKDIAEEMPPQTRVWRGGQLLRVLAETLVPGDVVELTEGDTVPADVRVLAAHHCKVDNCSLVCDQELRVAVRGPLCSHSNPLETQNLAFAGTCVLEGWMRAVVLTTGDCTVVGRTMGPRKETSWHDTKASTPTHREMHRVLLIIAFVAFVFGVVFSVITLLSGYRFLEAFVFLISIVVANVPEGIVCTVTVCLTLAVRRMRRRSCVVKTLKVAETLGCTSVVCVDKTGTLTQNRMTVVHVWSGGPHLIPCHPQAPMRADAQPDLLRCALLCSRAEFTQTPQEEPNVQRRTASGDPTEIAILRFCERVIGDVKTERAEMPKVAEIPFNAYTRYQVSVHRRPDSAGFLLAMKGAPEEIVSRCISFRHPESGEAMPVDAVFQQAFERAFARMTRRGERVLGFCDLELDEAVFPPDFQFDTETPNFPLTGLRFLGLLALVDPPRPGVPEAVRQCHSANIRVLMVTGDHPLTAEAIAEQVHILDLMTDVVHVTEPLHDFKRLVGRGIEPTEKALVIHGDHVRGLDALDLQSVAQRFRRVVFARTTPDQKLAIVTAFQAAGHVVVATGRRVQDASALVKADVGFAMGITGTQVAQGAADVLLLDDNFASIVASIEEGRLIFDNLKKSIAYALTSHLPELPMSVVAILCIDLGTGIWPTISLAYEPPESDIMARPPRDARKEGLVTLCLVRFSYLHIGVLQAFAGLVTCTVVLAENGWHLRQLYSMRGVWDHRGAHAVPDSYGQEWDFEARKDLERCCHGAFFYAIVVVQWADLLISKTRTTSILEQGFGNHYLNTSIVFTALFSLLVLYVPYVNHMFQLVGLHLLWALVPVPFAWAIFLYDEGRRWWIRRYPAGLVYSETYY